MRHGRGVTVLEAALILPVMVAILFGGIEFSHYVYARHVVSNAAREAVRVASMPDGTGAMVTTRVNAIVTPHGWSSNDFTITTTVNGAVADPSTATAGQTIGVTVSGTWGNLGVAPLGLIPGARVVSSSMLARREG
jgi:Flp pilus assembly protein TadG